MDQAPNVFKGNPLTGIEELEGTLEGRSAAIWASGPTFADYNDGLVPEDVVRVAINETVKSPPATPDFWVLSDTIIVEKFARYCPAETKVLAMHMASLSIDAHCGADEIFTVNSMPEPPEEYDNPFQFFSRKTVVIGAVEMLRFMGVKRFFFFGFDAFRTAKAYYFNGDNAFAMGEQRVGRQFQIMGKVHNGQQIFCTPNLSMGRNMVHRARKALWDPAGVELWNVNSPNSQQTAIANITWAEFVAIFDAELSNEEKEPSAAPRKDLPDANAPKPEDVAAAVVAGSSPENAVADAAAAVVAGQNEGSKE